MLRIIFYNTVSFFIIILIFEIILTFLPVNQGFEFYEVNKNSLFSKQLCIEAFSVKILEIL